MLSKAKVSAAVVTIGVIQLCCSVAIQGVAHSDVMRRELGTKAYHRRRGSPFVYHRRRGSPSGTINLEFGGDNHGKDDSLYRDRPEVVKSERCDNAVCHACQDSSGDGCWHGVMEGSVNGHMTVAVPANTPYNSFVQEVFLSCESSGGDYALKVEAIHNGKIAVYVNNIIVRDDITTASSYAGYSFNFDKNADARVRVVFSPINAGSPSSATAALKATNVDESVDQCMTGKLCMNKLGDGSNAAYKLRNNNDLQYKCLESGASSLDSDLQSVCTAWDGCLSAEHKNTIKVLLKISGASLTGFSFAEKVSAQGNLSTSGDPNSCINPAVDDPESWDCECIEDMTASCGGVDEACFKGIICGKPDICQTWKDEAGCPTFLVQKDEGEISGTHSKEALGQRNQEISSSGIAASLDGSLQGKCSQ